MPILAPAVAVQRMAFRDDPQRAAYALRAVIYAATKAQEQAQQRVDYLTRAADQGVGRRGRR
jgi:hypothetical protein